MGLVTMKIDAALRIQAVRLVTEHRAEYSSEHALHIQVAESLGVSREPVQRWVMQYEVDAGRAAGVSTHEREELRRLRAENKRIREVYKAKCISPITFGCTEVWA